MAGKGNGRWALVGAVAAVAALVLAGLWIGAAGSVTEPVRLPDGTQVRIRSVVVGREMRSPYDSALSRWVARLPGPLRDAVGRVVRPSKSIPTGMPSAMGVWLECEGVPAWSRTNSAGPDSAFLLVLNDGRPFRISAAARTSSRLPDGRYVEGHFFPVPPAALPQISAALFPRPSSGSDDPEEQPPLARWSIAPGPVPAPTNWVGAPMPQRRTSEDLEAVLTNLMVNAYSNEAQDMAVSTTHFLQAWASARFELFESGRPVSHWQVERVHSLEDASGGNLGSSQTWQNGSNYVQWRPVLWPGQLWKLGVEFTRVSGFATNEMVTFTNLVPGVLQTHQATTVNGSVSAKQVGDSHSDSDELDLVMAFHAKRLPARLTLLSVTDARGFPVQGARSSWSDTETTFRLKSSPANAPFTATFALQLGRVLEFVAEPAVGLASPLGLRPSAGP